MSTPNQPTMATCPDCEEPLDLGSDPEKGEKLTCPECWAYLEVISLTPLKLAWVNGEFEDEESENWPLRAG